MANVEKEILRQLCKYAEMVNVEFTELEYRIRILQATIMSKPEFQTPYNLAVAETKERTHPQGLGKQLSAVQQAIERLPN
jgi:hypothetical protein